MKLINMINVITNPTWPRTNLENVLFQECAGLFYDSGVEKGR